MSLKSLIALISDELESVFHKAVPSADKARAKALKTISTARSQFGSTSPTRGRKAWRAQNNTVAWTGGYAIDGKKTVYVPAERFNDFLTNLENAINSGEMDSALLADQSGDASAGVGKAGKPRKQRTAEEIAATSAKRAATLAARGIKPGRKAAPTMATAAEPEIRRLKPRGTKKVA